MCTTKDLCAKRHRRPFDCFSWIKIYQVSLITDESAGFDSRTQNQRYGVLYLWYETSSIPSSSGLTSSLV